MNEENGHTTIEATAIAKDSEGVVELRAVELDTDAGASTQKEADLWTPQDTIEPPENPMLWGQLTKYSSVRGKCINAMARNEVGLGWDVDVWPEHQGDVDRDEVRDVRHRIDALARRDVRLDRPSFSTLMFAVIHDLHECGCGYLEVSRNRRTGQIDGLYHLPGEKVRRRRDRTGWVMGQNPELTTGDATRVDYLNFGSKVEYDSEGRPQRRLASPGGRWNTNEVIALRVYTSESRDYGLPRDAALSIEYLAAKFVDQWTEGFFQNSGVPPSVMFVQGQEQRDGNRVRFKVDASMVRRIEQAVKSGGPARRVVVVPVPPGTNVSTEKLSELSDRDITFTDFRKHHANGVGSAFGLSPPFYGGEDDGRYTIEVQRALTLEETFDPDQREIEDKLWTTLMVDLGYSGQRILFKRMAVESDAAKREAAQNGATVGAITVGEWRHANGYGPLPWDGDPNDPENPNNKLFTAGPPPGDPHQPVDVEATQDERGLRPGIGGRGPRRDPAAKTGDDDHPEHVEEEVDELAAQLREYGPAAS